MENVNDFRVQGDRLLIKIETAKEEQKTSSGIIIPATAEESSKPCIAEVIQIGNKVLPEDADVVEKQHILVSKYAGTAFNIAGVEYRIIRAIDVIMVKTLTSTN